MTGVWVGRGVVSPPGGPVALGVGEGVGFTTVGTGVVSALTGGSVGGGGGKVGIVVGRDETGGRGAVGITNVGTEGESELIGGSVEVGTATVGIVVTGVDDGTGRVGVADACGVVEASITVRVPFLPGIE